MTGGPRCILVLALCLAACSGDDEDPGNTDVEYPEFDDGLPPAGNPDGECPVPDEAMAADSSDPDAVIGDGTPESCTSAAVVEAIAGGGIITFDCGPEPLTIELQETARIFNDTGPEIVIDGGGLITLSGGGERRILYMNTCDQELVWTTDHCNDQDHPRLTVQNLTFIDADSSGEPEETDGGGAIWIRGGRFKLVNSRFFSGVCAETGPDVGGVGARVFDQHEDREVYVVHSTFGGTQELGNVGSNGGGVSSIGVSWTIINSLFQYNLAVGEGGNPEEEGTPGGGSGGAIYNDGLTMTLMLCGVNIEHNEANTHGAAIFFVSNNHDGTILIEDSVIRNNTTHSGSPWELLPGISGHDDTTLIVDDDSIVE